MPQYSVEYVLAQRERSGGFSNINMGLRSDITKGGTNVNSTASGNTKDSDISYP